jgi:hypothetical protein
MDEDKTWLARALEQLPDWLIGLIIIFVFLLYLAGFTSSRIRSTAERDEQFLRESLPGLSGATTLLGLVLTSVAVLTRYIPVNEVDRFNAVLMFFGGTAFFLFAYVFLSRFGHFETTYLSVAAVSSAWYCLGWSYFALFSTLLSTRHWPEFFLAAPLSIFVHTLVSLRGLYQTEE